MNLGHSLPICLCRAPSLSVHKSYMGYICMLNGRLSDSFFFLPHIVLQAHLYGSPEPFAPADSECSAVPSLCYTRRASRLHQAGQPPATAIHPAKVPPLRARGETFQRCGIADSQRLQPPAGLACANLFCRASTRVHTGHLGGVWSSTFSSPTPHP